jgi:diaminopimelate decarboxylase
MFRYHDHSLHCDAVALETVARRYGTPLYVYSAETIRSRYRSFDRAFRGVPHTICYSVKASSTLGILKLLAKLGAGFDVVSGGELERVRRSARGRLKQTVFSGVGKTEAELDLALQAGILLFNIESEGELGLLAARATRLKKKARVALRVNPDVPAETHPYISTGMREHKFGVAMSEARRLYGLAARERWLEVAGVSVHIGSQITDVAPFRATMERVAALVRELRSDGHKLRYVDAGGGLGIDYQGSAAARNEGFKDRCGAYATAVTPSTVT